MGLLLPPSFFPFLFMHFIVLLLVGSVPDSVHYGNETDRQALLAFKAEITGDPLGILNSWNESVHFCQWVRVTCSRRHQRVTRLNLTNGKLTGSISPHIGNLSFLMSLTMENNSLSHNIPQEISYLRRLKFLTLYGNLLTGEIPVNISHCSNLVVLEFSSNRLTGKIPKELGHLSKLQGLYIGLNNLTGGVPATIGNLSSLTILYISENNFGGNIPDDLGRLTNLEAFAVAVNRLVGTIPSSLFNLSSITGFDIGNNQIEGILPSNLGTSLPNLDFLGVGYNSLTGSIPSSISNATNLNYLLLTGNNFTGKMPRLDKLHNLWWLFVSLNHLGTGETDDLSFLSSLINATHLEELSLSENGFGGLFPEAITNFSIGLIHVDLSNNKLYGSIPRGIGNLVNLQELILRNNHLTGSIPVDFGKLQNLQRLALGGNRFSGYIPSSFGNFSLLLTLDLSENNLHGSIPSSLSKCQMLLEITLAKNSLSGTIPKEVVSLLSLFHVDLSHNNLSGFVPIEIGVLKHLNILNISENLLVGNIPSALGSCVQLVSLNLKGNKFSGILPSTLSQLRGLEELDISMNDFSGKIPDYLADFRSLEKLNISFNDFEEAVPKRGIFTNAVAISLEGNKKLCGGIPDLKLRSCQSKRFARKKFTRVVKLVLPLSFGLVCLFLMMYFVYLRWCKKRTKVPSFSFFGHSFAKLSYRSLVKATNGFSPTNLIGMGGFGSVYKGILDLDQGEKLVAVKVLNLQFWGASKSFIAECKALKSIRHRNLVNVLTACSSVDYKGDDFKALVYEFMVNGSLEEWLHPNEKEDDARDKSQSFDLLQRLNIAIDVGSAVLYLHHDCSESIVHCDLKPSNVLLDVDMVGHVGDFGLARFLVEATRTSSANESSSIGLRGSSGYAAPEYGMGNEVSTSGDVYSFGILLLEMFTGKRPTDIMFDGDLTLHNFVKIAVVEQVANIGDPTLVQQAVTGETSSSINISQNQSPASINEVQECLTSILKVGIACSEELPSDRPDIKEIVTQLHVIKNTLLRVGVHGGGRARIAS